MTIPMGDPIYLDYNATTPVAPEVLDAMLPALRDLWGNPSSDHAFGRRARQALDLARAQVASLLGCAPEELIFTSGGTESDNAAVIGVAEALAARGRHIVVSNVEHAAIDMACRALEERGFTVTRVAVAENGRLDPAAVVAAFRTDTALVSVVHGQNETGVLQPIREIAFAARARGIVSHTDAAQTVGKIRVRVDELGVDLLTVAGHKLYAPKGVGALYLRRGTPFAPLLRGAGHEDGRRSGTENVPGIVGLGVACNLAERELPRRTDHLRAMRDRLEQGLRRFIPDLVVHGAGAERLPNTLHAAFPGTASSELLARVDSVATAAGAACHTGHSEPSRILRAMGVSDALALCTLRLTVGRPTTAEEVDEAARRIGEAARTAETTRRP